VKLGIYQWRRGMWRDDLVNHSGMGVFVALLFIFSPLCLQHTEKSQFVVEQFCSEFRD
jgi:hypothetical protein